MKQQAHVPPNHSLTVTHLAVRLQLVTLVTGAQRSAVGMVALVVTVAFVDGTAVHWLHLNTWGGDANDGTYINS